MHFEADGREGEVRGRRGVLFAVESASRALAINRRRDGKLTTPVPSSSLWCV